MNPAFFGFDFHVDCVCTELPRGVRDEAADPGGGHRLRTEDDLTQGRR